MASSGPRQPTGGFNALAASIALILLTGCSGRDMLKIDQKAPSLSARSDGSIQTIDGGLFTLEDLAQKGPVVLVLLRGFS